MVKPVILMRACIAEQEEKDIAEKYFQVCLTRGELPSNSFVIGRYSVLPYYKELEKDLQYKSSSLVNSYRDHAWIADLEAWYYHLKDYTFKTWFDMSQVPKDAGPFVVKGSTNSKKQEWSTHMFAEDWDAANRVHTRLSNDGLIGQQGVVIRKYEKLRSFGTAIGGMPITEEYRFFYLGTKQLVSGFYWSEHPEVKEEYNLAPSLVPNEFLEEITHICAQYTTFYVIDIGRTEAGEWRLIEVNDAQMSGLSECDPDSLYRSLKETIK